MEEEHYIKECLEKYVNENVHVKDFKECILYALQGGKKIRSKIYLSILKQISSNDEELYNSLKQYFIAVEYVHTASLILDDMPHMDDDDVRRDKPSVHIKFSHALAQLSAFVLIQLATQSEINMYHSLAENGIITDKQFRNIVKYTNDMQRESLGEEHGLAGGQHIDLFNCNRENYITMITGKTAKLFEVSFSMPYYLISKGDVDEEILSDFKRVGILYGLLFQITDDLEDEKSDPNIISVKNIKHLFTDEEIETMVSEYKSEYHELCNKLNIQFDLYI